jgi:hypothetical protein
MRKHLQGCKIEHPQVALSMLELDRIESLSSLVEFLVTQLLVKSLSSLPQSSHRYANRWFDGFPWKNDLSSTSAV